ncbi:MAG: hypothetical protein ACHQXL_03805, partial [Candidatus Limnocylindrales bacterium]
MAADMAQAEAVVDAADDAGRGKVIDHDGLVRDKASILFHAIDPEAVRHDPAGVAAFSCGPGHSVR